MPEQIDPHRHYWDALLERVSRDPYPSTMMLDLLERDMHAEDRPRLVAALVAKAEADRYPSPSLVKRIARIAR
jgi:hypothetical protein